MPVEFRGDNENAVQLRLILPTSLRCNIAGCEMVVAHTLLTPLWHPPTPCVHLISVHCHLLAILQVKITKHGVSCALEVKTGQTSV